MDLVVLNMTEVTSNAADGVADIGDTFQFEVTVDLPYISTATDVTMEIFGFDPLTGVGGFVICGASQKTQGSNVVFESGPTYENIRKLDFDNVASIFLTL